MRINKFLADSGVASRRRSDKLIEEGAVKINGKTCVVGQEVN
ncbi:MAG: 23S rRNA pseudouridine synthase F, partial [Clostridia bacterium]|nr:23S rRNA pseudouridine synthase F [Clostridia bacterium]